MGPVEFHRLHRGLGVFRRVTATYQASEENGADVEKAKRRTGYWLDLVDSFACFVAHHYYVSTEIKVGR